LRGEPGKTTVLFILNTDPRLEKALRESRALIDGAEVPPIFAHGTDFVSLVDQARRWLQSDGGDWPPPNSEVRNPAHKGRPKGSTKKTEESIIAEIEAAATNGMSWREVCRSRHLKRFLSKEDLETFKVLYFDAGPHDEAGVPPESPSKCA
jgi:hypothetical protein